MTQHITFKQWKIKVKEKFVKKTRENIIYRGIKISIISNFSSEIVRVRRGWAEIECLECDMKYFLPYWLARSVTAVSDFWPPNVNEGFQNFNPTDATPLHGDC